MEVYEGMDGVFYWVGVIVALASTILVVSLSLAAIADIVAKKISTTLVVAVYWRRKKEIHEWFKWNRGKLTEVEREIIDAAKDAAASERAE